MTPLVKGLLLVHILAALWFGAGLLAGTMARAQGRRATSAAARLFAARLTWRLSRIFTLPGLMVAGLVGAALVTLRGFSFHLGWVFSSMIIYLILLICLLFVLTPYQWRAALTAEASEGADPDLEGVLSARLPALVEGASALMMLVLIFLMTVRP